MSNFSLKLDDQKIAKLKETFKEYIKPSPNEYIELFIQKPDLTISVYASKKVVFQGNDAFFYASAFLDSKRIRQAGSDEVGTGDVFGPVVVCAAIVEEEDYDYLSELGVTDSKQMSDEYILKIGEELLKRFKHSLLILDNATYNRVHETNNLNAIKAKMHNQAYINMINKGYDIPNAVYLDQFCSIDNYYRYLVDEKNVFHNITFETKAEEKYPAVALASTICRYAFLTYMNKLEEQYHFHFQKGSSDTELIDSQIKEFIKIYGKDKLKNVAKLHFKNFDAYR